MPNKTVAAEPSFSANDVPCSKRRYDITQADLPLSCPPRVERVWDAHPRVYLPIEATGEFTCPYCGALYVLTDFRPVE